MSGFDPVSYAGVLDIIVPSKPVGQLDEADVSDDLVGEQEAISDPDKPEESDLDAPAHFLELLTTLNDVSRGVSDGTHIEYSRQLGAAGFAAAVIVMLATAGSEGSNEQSAGASGLPASATALVVVVTVVTEEDAKSSGKLEIDTHVVRVSRRRLVVVVVGSTHGPGAIAATTTMVVGKDHCPSQSNGEQSRIELETMKGKNKQKTSYDNPSLDCAIGEGGVNLGPRIVRPPESVQPTGQLRKAE
ncbi:hypothetical protein EDB89DRAFT_1910614 [Lactarius sanguifluus]|nr:hypothetical protein EDB89DRAFT_1910614 [Lactarius sanguifluus]